MKKKFISVAMFLALAVSSPVWVGCADYDDDIANLQSQVDGLKSSVEVSKSEALQALEQAQAALQADIDELTAGKADEQAVKDLQATVADLQTALDNNDITAAGELAQKVNDLVEQVNAIPTELEGVRDDLNTQKEELQGNIDALQGELNTLKEQMANAATDEDVAAIQAKIDEEIMPKLEQATADIVEINNKLTEIEPWIEQNGEELAKLTANVTKINNLINTISQETAETISDPAILAAIKNLPSDTNKSLADLQDQIDALEQQLQGQGGETGEGEETSLLSRLEELEEWKQTITNDLIEGGEYTNFKQLCEDIVALQVALNGNPEDLENNPGLIAQYNELKAQMAKFDMIQSVVYLPKVVVDNNGGNTNVTIKEYLLESSQLKVKAKDGSYKALTQKIDDNTIQFRVSPASKAKEFIGDNPRYVLSFDGSLLHDNKKAFDKVKVNGAAKLVDEAAGIIQYNVTTNLEENDIWAVCAVITSQDVKNAEGEVTTPADGTNLSTTYFMAKQSTVKVDKVEILIDGQATAALNMPYKNGDGSESSIDFAKKVKVKATTSDSKEIEDLVAEYGVPTLTYDLSIWEDKDDVNKDDDYFDISDKGVLTIPGGGTNVMIGREVTVTIAPNFGFELGSNGINATAKVTITRRMIDYEIPGVKNLSWSNKAQAIAITQDEINAFVLAAGLNPDDLEKLTTETPANWGTVVFTTGEKIKDYNSSLDVEDVADKYYIYVPANVYTDKEQTLELKLTAPSVSTPGSGEGSSTSTDTYTLKVKVSAVDFGVKEIVKNSSFWTSDGQTLEFRPDIKQDATDNNALESVSDILDFKHLFSNLSDILTKGGKLHIEFADKKAADEMGLTLTNATNGAITIDDVNDVCILSYDKSNTKGDKVVELKMWIEYNIVVNGQPKVQKFDEETTVKISVQQLSGVWNNPSDMNQSVKDLDQTYKIAAGATWVDYRGKKMWDGSDATYSPIATDKNKHINGFAVSPFAAESTEAYALVKPTFSIVNEKGEKIKDQYITVNATTGEVRFTDDAKKFPWASPYTVTVRISAASPWGAIKNMEQGYVDVKFTIEAGAQSNN